MRTNETIKVIGRWVGFALRHLVALVVTVSVPCALWTLIYFALLLGAVLFNGGLGGPLAYPGGLLMLLGAETAAAIVLFFPATALAEWFARRRDLPVLAQIPISTAIFTLLCLGVVSLAPVPKGPPYLLLYFMHLLTLGLYWWTDQSGPLLLSLLRRLRGRPLATATVS